MQRRAGGGPRRLNCPAAGCGGVRRGCEPSQHAVECGSEACLTRVRCHALWQRRSGLGSFSQFLINICYNLVNYQRRQVLVVRGGSGCGFAGARAMPECRPRACAVQLPPERCPAPMEIGFVFHSSHLSDCVGRTFARTPKLPPRAATAHALDGESGPARNRAVFSLLVKRPMTREFPDTPWKRASFPPWTGPGVRFDTATKPV